MNTYRLEFQAVILAGPGTNLSPLTRHYVRGHGLEEPVPKALLPVGNKEMLNYPLAWLDAAGVSDVLIVCPASHRPLMSHFVYSSAEFPALRITLQTIDDEDSMGTADVLREISSSIQADFIVLPCDFIPPPNLTLSALLDAHRMDADGPILTSLLYERGEISKDGPPPLLVGLEEKSRTLAHIPVEESGDDVNLRMSMLWKRTVLDLLAERTDLSSIKEELIPWLCRTQYRVAARRKYGSILKPIGNTQALALEHSTVQPAAKPTRHYAKKKLDAGDAGADSPGGLQSPKSPPTAMSIASSVPTSPRIGGLQKLLEDEENKANIDIRCAFIVHKMENGTAIRANTVKTYFEANRLPSREQYQPQQATPGSTQPGDREYWIDPKAQISSDSLVGPSTKIAERTSIKKSVIGSHCVIGRNVRISGCVLMDHVVVKDGAKLDGCILSRHTVVEEKCSAKESETATGVTLAAGGDYKNERVEQFEYDED
ncbi:hypothetical protein FRC01_001187 [Tulasnella sp. 417]|nr:hypothetical protein FRC01_001187 [Tulasnella sp. 417]